VYKKDIWVEEILAEREKLAKELKSLKITEKVFPSDANFVLVQVKDALNTYQHLMEEGVIVRDRSKVVLCYNCLRITVGTPEENKKLIESLKKIS
jgi:histidinol-phosphate aminotransferase